MPPTGFEPDIPEIKWSQAYALDHEDTVISIYVQPCLSPSLNWIINAKINF
jgi:hypothetical protein